jgi:hypothetical protein
MWFYYSNLEEKPFCQTSYYSKVNISLLVKVASRREKIYALILEFACRNLIVQGFDFSSHKNRLIKIKILQHLTQRYSVWESLSSICFWQRWVIYYTAVVSNINQYLINHGGAVVSLPKVAADRLALLLLIQEVLDSNLAPETGSPDKGFRSLPQFLQANSEIVP